MANSLYLSKLNEQIMKSKKQENRSNWIASIISFSVFMLLHWFAPTIAYGYVFMYVVYLLLRLEYQIVKNRYESE